MERNVRKQAEPKVRDYREISVEADRLRRELQARLKCSANELAERAIHALAAASEQEPAA
jgi:hypothetical protein